MLKTSVYLDKVDKRKLEGLAYDLGISQSELIRKAIWAFETTDDYKQNKNKGKEKLRKEMGL